MKRGKIFHCIEKTRATVGPTLPALSVRRTRYEMYKRVSILYRGYKIQGERRNPKRKDDQDPDRHLDDRAAFLSSRVSIVDSPIIIDLPVLWPPTSRRTFVIIKFLSRRYYLAIIIIIMRVSM